MSWFHWVFPPPKPKGKWDITVAEAIDKYGSALKVVKELSKEYSKVQVGSMDMLILLAITDLAERLEQDRK